MKNLEYYKKKYSTNNKNKYDMKTRYESFLNSKSNSRISSTQSLSNQNIKSEKNFKISEDDYIFQKNLISLDEKINNNFKSFHYNLINKSKKKISNDENEDINLINNKKMNSDKINKNLTNNKRKNNIYLEINYNNPEGSNESFIIDSVNLLNKVENLKNLINDKINDKIKKNFPNYIIEKISLLGSNSFLLDNKLLIDYNLSNSIVAIVIYKKLTSDPSEISSIVPIDLIPKLTKPGYKTIPEYYILCRMSSEELSNLPNFKIYNDYGEVRFLSKVNLLKLDIDDECIIEKDSIELKDHLNVKRKCILYNLKLNDEENIIEEYKKKISENNGVFVSYNKNTGRLEWDYIN